jgi:uncharacterized protein YjbJ (UPF0337 family)
VQIGCGPGHLRWTSQFHPAVTGHPEGVGRGRRPYESGFAMGLSDKIDNQAEETKGKVKEGVGKATDDEQLEAEGKTDHASGSLKQAGEKVKDVFKD